MENLLIERHPETNVCLGRVGEDGPVLRWRAATISISDVEGNGFILSRDEALELADELWAAALDA